MHNQYYDHTQDKWCARRELLVRQAGTCLSSSRCAARSTARSRDQMRGLFRLVVANSTEPHPLTSPSSFPQQASIRILILGPLTHQTKSVPSPPLGCVLENFLNIRHRDQRKRLSVRGTGKKEKPSWREKRHPFDDARETHGYASFIATPSMPAGHTRSEP